MKPPPHVRLGIRRAFASAVFYSGYKAVSDNCPTSVDERRIRHDRRNARLRQRRRWLRLLKETWSGRVMIAPADCRCPWYAETACADCTKAQPCVHEKRLWQAVYKEACKAMSTSSACLRATVEILVLRKAARGGDVTAEITRLLKIQLESESRAARLALEERRLELEQASRPRPYMETIAKLLEPPQSAAAPQEEP